MRSLLGDGLHIPAGWGTGDAVFGVYLVERGPLEFPATNRKNPFASGGGISARNAASLSALVGTGRATSRPW